jgi:hypothetical protein
MVLSDRRHRIFDSFGLLLVLQGGAFALPAFVLGTFFGRFFAGGGLTTTTFAGRFFVGWVRHVQKQGDRMGWRSAKTKGDTETGLDECIQ